MARSNEPFWWSLFAAGGMVAAMLLPITIAITGIAVPAGWITAADLQGLIANPIVRLYLFVCISLPFFHWAHRFRFTLRDMGLKQLDTVMAVLFYGTAIGATICAAWLLVRL